MQRTGQDEDATRQYGRLFLYKSPIKITEYVNIINKTQESLGETYQRMNGIKKKIAQEIEKATRK